MKKIERKTKKVIFSVKNIQNHAKLRSNPALTLQFCIRNFNDQVLTPNIKKVLGKLGIFVKNEPFFEKKNFF